MNKKNIILYLIIVIILHVLILAYANFQSTNLDPRMELTEKIYINIARIPKESPQIIKKNSPNEKYPKKIDQTDENNIQVDKKKHISNEITVDKNDISLNLKLKKNDNQSNLKNNNLAKDYSDFLPRSGKLSILVYYGDYSLDSTPIGKGFIEITYPSPDSYKINLKAQVVGWAAIFVKKPLFYESIGSINDNGLLPKVYRENTPRRGESFVEINEIENTIFFSTINKKIMIPSDNFFDPLSLVFQLSWLSKKQLELDFGKLSSFLVFNRKKFQSLNLTADHSEDIVLPGGILVEAVKIKSTVIKNKRPGAMSFWLDPSDNYLPVRISYQQEKTNKSIDFVVIRNEYKNNKSNNMIIDNYKERKKLEKKSHPYLPNY